MRLTNSERRFLPKLDHLVQHGAAVVAAFGIAWWLPGDTGDSLSDWLAVRAIIDGMDPYDHVQLVAERYGFWIVEGIVPRMPGALLINMPLALIPLDWVTVVSRFIVCIALYATWRLARPRWWVAPLLLYPAALAVWWGNFSSVVTFLVALAVFRESGIAVGLAAVLRAWPWYLGLVMLRRGRLRPALISAGTFVGLNAAGFLLPGVTWTGMIGAFAYSENYLHILRNLAVPTGVGIACAVTYLLVADRVPFRWSVVPALLLSPAIWVYYLPVLMVPMGRGSDLARRGNTGRRDV